MNGCLCGSTSISLVNFHWRGGKVRNILSTLSFPFMEKREIRITSRNTIYTGSFKMFNTLDLLLLLNFIKSQLWFLNHSSESKYQEKYILQSKNITRDISVKQYKHITFAWNLIFNCFHRIGIINKIIQ